MKVGADRKRLIFLGVLAVIGGYVLWTNVFSSSSEDSAPTGSRTASSSAPAGAARGSTATEHVERRRDAQVRSDWHPDIPHDAKNVLDPAKVDPTLRLDLLAKVQHVEMDAVQRNLFQFGAAPPPPTPAGDMKIAGLGKIPIGPKGPQPGPLQPTPNAGASKPPPPPINLKYYGYSNARDSSHKRAFFLDGDDIIIASEGELIKKRYKLVKIGVNSVTMEDTQFSSQQTLPLTEDPTSAANPTPAHNLSAS